MAPSAILEDPEITQFTGVSPEVEILPFAARTRPPRSPQVDIPVNVKGLFNSALIEQNRITRGSRLADVTISVVLHLAIISVPVLASLYFTDTLNLKQFAATMLVAPPPPPPPPLAAVVVKTVAPHRVFMNQGKLVAPNFIPQKVAEIKEAPLQPDFDGLAGGVPGGVPGGQMGGVIGGVIGGVTGNSTPLAPASAPKAPIRVGGRIKAPRAIYQPPPVYPTIARQGRISGVVLVDAVLDEQGGVVNMKVVSGPPLLYGAALDALKQWKFEPTYLNDSPISVQMIVSVTFQLNLNQYQ